MASCALRNRVKQLAARLQDVEETAETLTSSDVLPTVFEVVPNYNIQSFQRNPYRSDLSKEAAITGTIESNLTFEAELKGAGTAGNEPNYSKLLIACGFISHRIVSFTVSGPSGSLTLGEVLTDNAGDTYLLFTVPRSTTQLLAVRITCNTPGTPNTATSITGAGGYSATVSAVAETYGWGFRPLSTTGRVVPVGTITGTYRPGEYIVGGTSGAIGQVVYIAGSNKSIWHRVISGTFANGETITGQVSGASATSSAAASCSQPTPPMTFYVNEDGVQRILSGSRGRVNFNCPTVGEPARMQFEFQGPGSTNPTDTAPFAESVDSLIPPKFQGAVIQFGDPTSSPFVPVAAAMNIQVENNIVSRQDATASSGLLSALIADRNFSGQMNPEAVAVATYNFHQRLFSDTTTRSYFQLGATNGNIVAMFAEALQFTNIVNGNRDEILIFDTTFQLVRTLSDDEFQLLVR